MYKSILLCKSVTVTLLAKRVCNHDSNHRRASVIFNVERWHRERACLAHKVSPCFLTGQVKTRSINSVCVSVCGQAGFAIRWDRLLNHCPPPSEYRLPAHSWSPSWPTSMWFHPDVQMSQACLFVHIWPSLSHSFLNTIPSAAPSVHYCFCCIKQMAVDLPQGDADAHILEKAGGRARIKPICKGERW